MDVIVNSQDNNQTVTAERTTDNLEGQQTNPEVQTQETEQQTQTTTTQETQVQQESEIQKSVEDQQLTTEKIKEDLAQRNVDFGALEDEYNQNGVLSDKSMKALADAGYPKEVVDAYLNGIEATQEKFYNTVIGYAGSEDEYAQITQFVQAQGEQAITAFNNALQGGNLGIIKMVIQGVKADMVATNGTTNQTILGQSTGVSMDNSNGFTSKMQMLEAMDDIRYTKDPAYRQLVEKKILNSTF